MLIEGTDLEVVWNGAHLNCDADLFNRSLAEPRKSLGTLRDDHGTGRSFDSRAEAWTVITKAMPDGITQKLLAQRAKISYGTAFDVLRTWRKQGRVTREARRIANNSPSGGSTEYVYRVVEDVHGD